tara:strand:+ start:2939 stop:5623 length:2685 start_codon:yes stop_codon:yes gene_type:complete
MGVNISLNYQKFFNQFDNGEDLDLSGSNFTSFLTGNCGEFLRNEIEVKISWTSESSATDIFSVNGNILTRSGTGDFETDSFVVGDIIDIWELNGTPSVIATDREISAITTDTITFDGASVGTSTLTDGIVYGKTPLESLLFNYGLIENNESVNFVSKVDGTATNEFFAEGIGTLTGGGTRSLIPVLMTKSIGVNSWKDDGDAYINYESTQGQSNDFAQVFKLDHKFRLFPFYLDGWQNNLTTLSPPFPEFQSTNCLKYVSRFEFRQFLNNPNGARIKDFSSVNGNTGWFDENFNGFTNNYILDSIVITDNATSNVLTELDFQKSCHVVLNVSDGLSRWNTGKDVFTIGVSYLPNANQYQQNQNTIAENFLFDSVWVEDGIAPVSSTILKNVEVTSATASTCIVEYDVEYSVSQQSLLSNESYLMYCGVNSLTSVGINSDRVTLLTDYKSYSFTNDVFDLMFMEEFRFVPHDLADTSPNIKGDYLGWIEDGFQIQTPFKLNTDLGASIDSISLDIVAYNSLTGEQFTIQTNPLDLSSSVISGGVQQINLASTNNFKLLSTSDFKKIELSNVGSGTYLTYNVENYESKIGVRFNFEEWIALLSANTDFFNASQLNNGLNLLSSNYSTAFLTSPQSDFQIKARLNSNVRDNNNVVTNYQFLSDDLKSYYYDLDDNDPTEWSGVINTFDTNGTQIDIIYNNNFTDIVATFNRIVTASDLTTPYGWIRLDIQQGTINTPFELSTLYLPSINSALIPLPTETFCKIQNVGTQIKLSCRIDFSKIPSGSIISLSARISESNDFASYSTWKIKECGEGVTLEYYTLTDLTAYIGQVVLFENGECWEVIGTDTKAPNNPFSTIVNDSFENCNDCGDGVKKMDGTSPIGNIIKTTEQGNIKTLE